MLWSFAAGKARPLQGTEGASYPFWSPDSNAIGFFSDGKLKKIPAVGGPVQTLADAAQPRGGTWSEDGTILFSVGADRPLQRVSSNGGDATPLQRESGALRGVWPQFVTRNRFIYLKVAEASSPTGIYSASLDSMQESFIVPSVTAAAYAAGHLFFARDGVLVTQLFDSERLVLSGNATPIAQNVGTSRNSFYASFSVSDTALVYSAGRAVEDAELVWMDRSGKLIGRVGDRAPWMAVNLSRDGKHAAIPRLNATTGGSDLWTFDLDRNIAARLTSSPGDGDGNWSADGKVIYLSSIRRGRPEIFRKNATGIGEEHLVAERGRMSDVSRDGHFLLQLRDGLSAISLPDMKSQHIINGPIEEARFSPNNKWIAFNTLQADRQEVYVVSFPAVDQRWQVSVGGGVQPRWRGDGKELFYLAPDSTMMRVGVDMADDRVRFSRPGPLFRTGLETTYFMDEYDVTADGQRFLLVRPVASSVPPPVNVLVNWSSALR
jgi:hypothetical protein